MLKAIKVRIYPNKEQFDFLNQQFGATRLVYKKGLHLIRHYYRRYGKSLNAKQEYYWLSAMRS